MACWYPITLWYWWIEGVYVCRNNAREMAEAMGMEIYRPNPLHIIPNPHSAQYAEFEDLACPGVDEFLEFPLGFVTSLGYFAGNPIATIPSLLITLFLVALGIIMVRQWEYVKRVGRYLTFGYLLRKWRRLIWTPVLLVSTILVALEEDEARFVGVGILAAAFVASFVTEPFVSKNDGK